MRFEEFWKKAQIGGTLGDCRTRGLRQHEPNYLQNAAGGRDGRGFREKWKTQFPDVEPATIG